MKSSYQIAQEVRAARDAKRPIFYVQAHGWRWGVYIAPCFATREDAEEARERSEAAGGARSWTVEVGT